MQSMNGEKMEFVKTLAIFLFRTMKHVYIFHGTWSCPQDFWFPYIQEQLDRKIFEVHIPALPHAEEPILHECLESIKEFQFDEHSILIGHSSGCPLILSILEKASHPVGRVICVAWFSRPIWWYAYPILQPRYNWEVIRARSRSFYFIHSLNDPWWCGKAEWEILHNQLGWTLILHEREGHMGSKKYHQDYREFPLLKALIELPL